MTKRKRQTKIYKTLHRRIDNTMTKRKRQTKIYKTLHRRIDNTMTKRKRQRSTKHYTEE